MALSGPLLSVPLPRLSMDISIPMHEEDIFRMSIHSCVLLTEQVNRLPFWWVEVHALQEAESTD